MTASASVATARSQHILDIERPANNTYYPALDGLRAMAFLMVFGNHYRQLPWGWTGVDLFFVLSGFLITGILFDTRNQPHRVRNFYIRRTLRIFPLYYGIMLLLVLSYPVFRWDWTWRWLAWPAYLGNFTRGIHPLAGRTSLMRLVVFQPLSRAYPTVRFRLGHFWSLCVEEQFYLIWPWVVFWLRDRKKLFFVCLSAVVACPLMRVLGNHTLPQFELDQQVLYSWTPFRVDALLLGGLIALALRGPSPRIVVRSARWVFAVLCCMLVVWLGLNPSARQLSGDHHSPSWALTWGLTYVDLLSGCLIVMAMQAGSVTYKIFNLRPLRWVGRISYGAYVFHDIFHDQFDWLVVEFPRPPHAKTVTALAFTLLLSWASFRWFESPFISLKNRWTRPPQT